MSSITTACIHQLQILRSVQGGTRNAQGEYTEDVTTSPTIRGRLMRPPPTRARGESGASGDTAAEVVVRYEWLAMPSDTQGNDVVIEASDRLHFIAAGPLGDTTIAVDGEPELLNNGREKIGWYGFGTVVEDVESSVD